MLIPQRITSVTFNLFARRNIHSACTLFSNKKNYYEILGVSKDATHSDIKDAYYKLSKVYHPDVRSDESSLTMFRSITEAYDVLGSIKSRQEYDSKKTVVRQTNMWDSSKTKFHSTLYQDVLERPFRAPNFEELLRNRQQIDRFLDEETKDRIVEVKMARERTHYHQYDSNGKWGSEKILISVIGTMIIIYPMKYFDDKYGWGREYDLDFIRYRTHSYKP